MTARRRTSASRRSPRASAPAKPRRRRAEKKTDIRLRVAPGSQLRITLEELPPGKPARPRLLHQSTFGVGGAAALPSAPAATKEEPRDWLPPFDARLWGTGRGARLVSSLRRAGHAVFGWATPTDLVLFGLALAVYLATRLIGLVHYPIYFFTDEAVQTVLAQDFVRDGLRDFAGRIFPTYFLNVYEFNLNLSVYAQILPLVVFGKSVFVTRATSAVLSTLGAAGIAYAVGRFTRVRYWWSAVLFLGMTPAWFLHSRTAFETTLMATFYGLFLAAYLLYRLVDARYIYLSLLLGAAVFYTYGPGQIISLATAILLLLVDLPYHWQNRRVVAPGLAFAAVLTLPYLRFQLQQPGAHQEFLRLLDSYWVKDLPLSQKLATALGNYLQAISPAYWFGENTVDLPRHFMGGYGNLSRWAIPFTAVGMVLCARRLRGPAHRVLWVALFAIPFGAVVVSLGITRVLSFALPVAAFSAIGLAALAERAFGRVPYRESAAIVLTALAGLQVGFLSNALSNGPTWNTDYGLYGMQYGASQVFGLAQDYLAQHPQDKVFVSSSWANGTDLLARYFVGDGSPISISGVQPWQEDQLELNDHLAFLLTGDEFVAVAGDPKFRPAEELARIPLPDGRLGFILVHLRYSEQAPAIFAEEIRVRLIPVVETVVVDGRPVTVEHPMLDMGELNYLFDDDEFTLVRTYEANPARFFFTFDSPRPLRGLRLTAGAFRFDLTVQLTSPSGETVTYTAEFNPPAESPTVELDFDGGPATTARMTMEVFHLDAAGRVKIHLRELRFLEAN